MIAVGIYIKEQSNIIEYLNATRVDNTFIKVDSTLLTVDLDNIYKPSVYNRVELFADENISVNSSIQNINDISKTFTDFSQTFTVPASKKNNKIFKHWYENSNDNGFSTLIKSDAYIELDTIPFRTGKIQLESCNIKNGKPQDYSITFIGALGSLKDTFAGLLLKDLNTGEFDFDYSDAIVRTKVTTQNNNPIKFPLITSDKAWEYATINTLAGTINTSELFPSIKLIAVMQLIQNKFGIVFNSNFLTTNYKFLNAHLLLKNSEKFLSEGQLQKVNFQTQTYQDSVGFNFNLTADILNLKTNSSILNREIIWKISNQIQNINYSIYMLKDGVILNKINSTSIVGIQEFIIFQKTGNAIDLSNYEFYLSSSSPITFTSTSNLETTYEVFDENQPLQDLSILNQTVAQSTAARLSVASYMPEQKIEDFFSGILKMFNLTCYSITDGIYNIETLEDYYNNGNVVNITKHIKSDNVSLNRTKTYDKINFKYEKSENILSINHLSDNRLSYGDLLADFDSDGSDYEIKLPFEHLKFASLNSNLTAGFLIKTDLKPYIPKPIILYDYGTLQTVPQFYLNGTTTTTLNTFGAETLIGGNVYALNFGIEQSVLNNNILNNSLYSEYYQAYLTNIFDFKARLIKVSAILPISLLTSLKLNDRLIIRDKRYLINTMQTNLITGEVQFELLTDNRIL